MKTSFISAALFPLLSLALLSSCDRSVSTVSSENGSVAVVPRFAAASVPAVSRLEARLSATGQSDSVVNVAYQKGGDLELGSVPSGAAFTVSMTGYDSISSQRLVRWIGSGSSTADGGSSAKYVDISTTSGPAAPSLAVGGTVVPQTLPLAGMWYTTDGTDPRLVSKAKKATGNVVIDSACTVRAAHDTVIAGDTLWSDTVSWTFTAAPSPVTTVAAPAFSVAGGSYASAQKVELSSTTSGASIYYTTNGATPTSSSTLYTDSLTVSASETIQAVAVLNGVASEVTSVTYTITPVTPTKSQYKLTVSSETGGTVTLSPTGPTFASGTVVTATATANSGYTFTGWTGACTGTSSSCKVTMTQDTTLGANFAVAASTDTTLSVLNVSVGKLTPNFSSKTTSYHDTVGSTATSETITAKPISSNATFRGDTGTVSLASLSAGDSVAKTVTVANGGKSLVYTVVIVKRALPKYKLTVTPPTGGTIALSPTGGSYDSGTTVIATAAASSGYAFSGWTDASKSTISVCTLTVTTNMSLSASFTSSITPSTGDTGHFTDSRDGQNYKYVKIGLQTWMAQNLNYRNTSGKSDTVGVCYDGLSSNCTTYGRLYIWPEIMAGSSSSTSIPSGVQGICPSGWHVPSDAEWSKLVQYADSSTSATKLKSTSDWSSSAKGTDVYGFNILPTGSRSLFGPFGHLGDNADFWSSSEKDASNAWYQDINELDGGVAHLSDTKLEGYSLRCLHD